MNYSELTLEEQCISDQLDDYDSFQAIATQSLDERIEGEHAANESTVLVVGS